MACEIGMRRFWVSIARKAFEPVRWLPKRGRMAMRAASGLLRTGPQGQSAGIAAAALYCMAKRSPVWMERCAKGCPCQALVLFTFSTPSDHS